MLVPPISIVSPFTDQPLGLSDLLECVALRCDYRHQFVPGFHKRLRAFLLELSSENVNVNARFGDWASTSSQSPSSAAMIEPSSVCSASAFNVPSGIVLTVNGAARATLMYRMSDTFGVFRPRAPPGPSSGLIQIPRRAQRGQRH